MHPVALEQVRVTDPRVPIMLVIDDPAPIAHVYRCHIMDVHHDPPVTKDGRPLMEDIPNQFLLRYIEVVERWGIRGKFSIVPGLGGRGELASGIDGGRKTEIAEWLDLARARLAPHMDFCPEMITHNLTVDLASGGFLPASEAEWSFQQTEATLTPYIGRALQMLRDAGIEATGVTSPWDFGIRVEPAYQRAVAAAMKAVYGKDRTWYFLHDRHQFPASRPCLVIDDPPAKLVSIPCTTGDHMWQTIDTARSGADFANEIADRLLSADGSSGQVRTALDAGGWPIMVTHWQSLFSNGSEAGLAALDEVGRRVAEHLSDAVVWCSASELMERTIRDGRREY